MKKLLLLLLVFIICLSLCSCESLLKKAKSMVTGEEAPRMPDDYVATLQNEDFEYELYEDYIKIIKYLGEDIAVDIPKKIDGTKVKVIGSFCFHSTKAKIVSVNIPDSIEEIEEGAFYLSENIKEITIPDSVKKLGPRVFAWCNGLEKINWGTGVTAIPDYCFNHCVSLAEITIPDCITSIGLRSFSYCEKLEEVKISAEVQNVGDRSFEECQNLKYVVFEGVETSLGKELFTKSPDVVIISPENSAAMEYCKENKLRWSSSKDIEATIFGDEESLDDVSE